MNCPISARVCRSRVEHLSCIGVQDITSEFEGYVQDMATEYRIRQLRLLPEGQSVCKMRICS